MGGEVGVSVRVMWLMGGWRWTLVTDLEKLARLCTTLAMSVRVREVRSDGYSCVRLNRDGDMMAGHRKRRNRDELMRRSAMSSRPRSAQRTRHDANTSFSSRGNTLQRENTSHHALPPLLSLSAPPAGQEQLKPADDGAEQVSSNMLFFRVTQHLMNHSQEHELRV